MKRLIFIAIVLGIAAYVTVQVIEDRRFNKLSAYDYPVNENIDREYHDKAVLAEYYKTVMEIGTFARSVWRTKGHDVRQTDLDNHDESLDKEYYKMLRAKAMQLEDELIKSKNLKDQGYSTKQVKLMLEQGMTEDQMRLKDKYYLVGLRLGSNGEYVWELQKMLNALGDSIPEDGIFNLITINRLKEFQSANDLFPSGEVTENTLKALLK